ncbi:tyrosine-type recombinase/integrase [Alienimonas sp. DA493]|uniref:tyrosine-type recombinase/integrase n=1 Tax=Alienimonas sp. DA493 TaxID=3373605 RepID=UPI003755339B
MANLGQKGGIYLARFRYGGREYKKSLKTRDRKEAENALKVVETTIHRLTTGTLTVPDGVNVGTFILAGGTAKAAKKASNRLTYREAVDRFETRQKPRIAATYLKSQLEHLRQLDGHLGVKAGRPLDRIETDDLRAFLDARMKERHANTVERTRQTLRQFFAWCEEEKHLPENLMAGVKRVGQIPSLDRFRNKSEIDALIARGGMSEDEEKDAWKALFLLPAEIGELLDLVKAKADDDRSVLLHALAAYTGMRRGEIARLKWDDVDLVRDTITAHSRKQSRRQKETPRTIDLHPALKPLLEKAAKAGGRFVIPDDDGGELNVDKADRLFRQPMRHTDWHLGGERFKVGFHTYRHSFASNLAMAGIDQRVINELMGHTTEEMAKRYRHLIPAKTKAAVGVLDYGAAP